MQDLSQIVKNIFMANYINKKYFIYFFFFQVKADSNPELQVHKSELLSSPNTPITHQAKSVGLGVKLVQN